MQTLKIFGFFLIMSVLFAVGENNASSAGFGASQWVTYRDTRFGFSIEYPSDWQIQRRADNPASVGEVLTLTTPDAQDGQVRSIAVGQYLYRIRPGETLSKWTNKYPSQFSASEKKSVIDKTGKLPNPKLCTFEVPHR